MKILVGCALAACVSGPDAFDEATTTTPATAASHDTASLDESDGFELQDATGAVAGVPGLAFARTPDVMRCGGIALTMVRSERTLIGAQDQPIVDLFAIRYPTGLDFSDATRETSLRRFQRWVEDTKAVAQTAIGFYKGRLAAATEPMQKVDAAARLTQIPRYFAGLLVRAEIPLDMRSGELALEKRDAFCDAMANAAEGLLGQATEAARACTTLGEALPASWWTPVCSVQ